LDPAISSEQAAELGRLMAMGPDTFAGYMVGRHCIHHDFACEKRAAWEASGGQ
jgi:hypothetical protein